MQTFREQSFTEITVPVNEKIPKKSTSYATVLKLSHKLLASLPPLTSPLPSSNSSVCFSDSQEKMQKLVLSSFSDVESFRTIQVSRCCRLFLYERKHQI